MKAVPSTEDRIWAVLAHLSALVTGMGLPLPIVGWAEQRRKSNYASFQCLQALGYQSLGYTVWVLSSLLIILVLVIAMMAAMSLGERNEQAINRIAAIGMFVIFVVTILSLGVYFLLPVIAAVACALGRDFRYPFMGDRLARYLDYTAGNDGWLNEDHEGRWVAAMGHFSVIIALWGMMAPLTAWIMQGKRNAFLKFQSVQALAFQTFVLLLTLAAGAAYSFGAIVFIMFIGFTGVPDITTPFGIAMIAILIISLVFAAVIMLIVPLFHIMGQWAGYRVLKGDDYRYPVLGKHVENLLQNRKAQPPMP